MDNRFRREVYQSFGQRADAGMDLVDALTSAPVVESPVGLSESPLFRREFSSIYDFLKSGEILYHILRKVLFPGENETDQLKRIVKLFGFPIFAAWPQAYNMPNYRHVIGVDKVPPDPEELFKRYACVFF